MRRFKGFWVYWFENIKAAKELREMTVFCLFAIASFILFICRIFGGAPTVEFHILLNAIELWSFPVVFVIAMFWLPFYRHEKEKSLNPNGLNDIEQPGGTKHLKEKIVIDNLGLYRNQLLDFAMEINKMTPDEYWGDEVLVNSKGNMLCDLILKYFDKHPTLLGMNAVAEFRKTLNKQRSIVPIFGGNSIHYGDWRRIQDFLLDKADILGEIADKIAKFQ